jgi:hypothetical protein
VSVCVCVCVYVCVCLCVLGAYAHVCVCARSVCTTYYENTWLLHVHTHTLLTTQHDCTHTHTHTFIHTRTHTHTAGMGYTKRVFIVYYGKHYDALVYDQDGKSHSQVCAVQCVYCSVYIYESVCVVQSV